MFFLSGLFNVAWLAWRDRRHVMSGLTLGLLIAWNPSMRCLGSTCSSPENGERWPEWRSAVRRCCLY